MFVRKLTESPSTSLEFSAPDSVCNQNANVLHMPAARNVHAATTVNYTVEMERNAAVRLQLESRVNKCRKLQALSHNHKQPVRPTPKTHGERSIQKSVDLELYSS